MTLLSPGVSVDTYLLGPGDMYFIPKGYPHHIENLRDDEMRFLIFFDNTTPEDIGFTGAWPVFRGGLSRQLWAAPRRHCRLSLPILPICSSSKRSTPHFHKDSSLGGAIWNRDPVAAGFR